MRSKPALECCRDQDARWRRTGEMWRLLAGALLALTWSVPAIARNCDNLKQNNPDAPVVLTISQDLAFGTVARPDLTGGSSLITISPTGTRSIPPNLVINRDLGISGRQPQAATATISGGPSCDVTITVASTTGSLQDVTLRNSSDGTSISSGAKVRLSGTGSFSFTIGTSQLVSSSTSMLGGTISIQVSY